MLNQFSSQPLVYFCLATMVFGFAIYISPKKSLVRKLAVAVLSQKGKVGIFLPLITSIFVSFVLTIVLKIFQG